MKFKPLDKVSFLDLFIGIKKFNIKISLIIMSTLKIILNILSTFGILAILISLPDTDSTGSNFGSSILGSPKKTSKVLQNIIWILIILIFVLSGIRALETI